jgi:GntR family transcriptional regulator
MNHAPPAIERAAAPRQKLYLNIASVLQQRIQDGQYPVASLLPAETTLTTEFDTSRNTVREALRLLVERGLVRRRQGSGTVVIAATPAVNYLQSITRLDDLFANARDTYYALHSIDTVSVDPAIADCIACHASERRILITGMRWTERGGTPISYIESYVPVEFAAHVEHFWDAQVPFYSILETATGRSIDDVSQHIRAVAMPRGVAAGFGLAPGAISLQVTRRYRAAGNILIASINWHRGDQFTYEMLIHRNRG